MEDSRYFVAPVCGDCGLWLGFNEISKIAASLRAMIYVDSKMAATALAKISGYNTPCTPSLYALI